MDEEQTLLDFRHPHHVRGRGFNIKLSTYERIRSARRYRQAVVKVTSYARGQRQIAHHLSYISRNSKLELETERGEILTTREEHRMLLDRWAIDFDDRPRSRDAVNIVFSMPPGSSTEALKASVRSVLGKQFPDHESVFAIHEDRQHPHAHVVIKMRGRESGKKLRLNKPELYQLREVFAKAAREQGVLLTASPRAARGIGEKAVRQPIYHMRKRGIKPTVDREAEDKTTPGFNPPAINPKPWEQAMAARNDLERKRYLASAKKLRGMADKATDPERKKKFLYMALYVERFARTMPKAKTRRETRMERLAQKSRAREPEKTKNKDQGWGLER